MKKYIWCLLRCHNTIFLDAISRNSPIFLKDERSRSEYLFGADPQGRSIDNFPGCK